MFRLQSMMLNQVSKFGSIPKANVQLYCFQPTCRFSWTSWMVSVATSQPVMWAQSGLEYIHTTTGLPWWMSIFATTLGLRMCVTFPLSVYQNKVLARYENLQPEIKNLAMELRKETTIAKKIFDWDDKTARYIFNRSMRKQVTSLIVKYNCHPLKSAVTAWIQLPIWISLSVALRNMAVMFPVQDAAAEIIFVELSVGGGLWFPNLTVPDPLFVIPILLGLSNLLIIEIHGLRKIGKGSKVQKWLTYFFRGFSIILIPVAMTMPSCVTLYWLSSSLVGLGQHLLLQLPKVRRLLKIPTTPSEATTPFRDIAQALMKRHNK